MPAPLAGTLVTRFFNSDLPTSSSANNHGSVSTCKDTTSLSSSGAFCFTSKPAWSYSEHMKPLQTSVSEIIQAAVPCTIMQANEARLQSVPLLSIRCKHTTAELHHFAKQSGQFAIWQYKVHSLNSLPVQHLLARSDYLHTLQNQDGTEFWVKSLNEQNQVLVLSCC